MRNNRDASDLQKELEDIGERIEQIESYYQDQLDNKDAEISKLIEQLEDVENSYNDLQNDYDELQNLLSEYQEKIPELRL